MTAHRHTVEINLRVVDHPILSRLANDPSFRVMIFCATEGYGPQDITFPHQSEIKVNSGEVKANLRGLKNKPGSTRPVDITKELRLNIAAYANKIEMTYALTNKASDSPQIRYQTQRFPALTNLLSPHLVPLGDVYSLLTEKQKFYLCLWVVKTVPVIDLVAKLQGGRRITKESVVNESKFVNLSS
jgi:E3 SUMO-protein ligase PIAS1